VHPSGEYYQRLDHIDQNEQMVYIQNKSSKDEVIEYNPEELSEDDSDNCDDYGQYQPLAKSLLVQGHAIPIYNWKGWMDEHEPDIKKLASRHVKLGHGHGKADLFNRI